MWSHAAWADRLLIRPIAGGQTGTPSDGRHIQGKSSIFARRANEFWGHPCPMRCSLTSLPLTREGNGFRLDLDRVREAIDDRTQLVMINSPNNPTGWVITPEDQAALLELAARHNFRILSDEVYERIVYDRPLARSFAVAVVASTGTPSGSLANRVRSRR